ncbi:ribonuclease H-like domain-containing protein [Oribacterium asaccharolyticum]|uniref:ribonuclease H-like domain-containing protein n=1 Tax=Oribacterium asaccharolyticum TaxID=1501332 RepID=UPI0028EBE2B7|nr:ribonuclease H-like domain-containing protein [Oribacterium asaccharolyticum]
MEIIQGDLAYTEDRAALEAVFTSVFRNISLEDTLLYDIETTGLNPKSSQLYLLGILLFHKENIELIQYFAESVLDEEEILEQFFQLCKAKKVLISFNGEGFDNRFVESMAKSYGKLPLHLNLKQLDLFKLIRKRKKFYGLESCSLKSCERFLGIHREDRCSGGELISVYQEYLQDKDSEKKNMLLLHNREDIQNLPALFSFLAYENIFQGNVHFQRAELLVRDEMKEKNDNHQKDNSLQIKDLELGERQNSRTTEKLCLRFSLPSSVPVPLTLTPKNFLLEIKETSLCLTVPLYQGELCYFFKDYKDYEFIPSEDRVVHKSLAAMYPKEMREKAKASTAYQKMKTSFLPVFQEGDKVFKKTYQDKNCFIPFKENTFESINPVEYLLSFLKIHF